MLKSNASEELLSFKNKIKNIMKDYSFNIIETENHEEQYVERMNINLLPN